MRLVFDRWGVLSHHEADGLLAGSNEEIFDALRKKLTGRVKNAYIFGSRATGRNRGNSDLDLILVADSKLPFHHRRDDFEDLFDLVPELDLLVYTPQEFQNLTERPAPGFWTQAVSEMVQVF